VFAQTIAAQSGQTLSIARRTLETRTLVFSPEGRRLASAGVGGPLQLWNVRDLVLSYTWQGQCATVDAIAWSPDGRYLASGGLDGIEV